MKQETHMTLLWRLVWLFTLGSLAGFLLESLESLYSLGYVQNRQGLLYGPFAPVYGTGAVVLALVWPRVKHWSKPAAFALAAILGTAVEYLWSWGQEGLFGAIFWDYRHFRFHLNGRVNLPFALFWGVLGLCFWQWVWPRFRSLWAFPARWAHTAVALVLALLLVGDGLLSAAALYRQAQRREEVAAHSPLQLYLDKAWPDEALRQSFPTMKWVHRPFTSPETKPLH